MKLKHWFYGLLATIGAGIGTGITLTLQAPGAFNFEESWKALVFTSLAFGISFAGVYLVKSPITFDEEQGSEDTKKIVKTAFPQSPLQILLISFLLIFGMSGCAGSHYSQLPTTATTADKQAAIAQDAKDWLANPSNQKAIHDALIPIGKLVIHKAVDADDQQQIKNQLYSVANAFTSLATGQFVTADDVNKTIQSFDTSIDISKYSDFDAEANLLWQVAYSKLKIVNDPTLTKTWLLVLADAAQKAAE